MDTCPISHPKDFSNPFGVSHRSLFHGYDKCPDNHHKNIQKLQINSTQQWRPHKQLQSIRPQCPHCLDPCLDPLMFSFTTHNIPVGMLGIWQVECFLTGGMSSVLLLEGTGRPPARGASVICILRRRTFGRLRIYFWIVFFRFFNFFCFSCFVAGAVLCGPCKAHFVAGAGLCGPWSAEFVAGAGLFVGLEVQISWQV